MNRETSRILFIGATILLALFYLYPTYELYYAPPENPDAREQLKQQAINLGLDLQGGIHLVLEVNDTELTEDEKIDVVPRALEVIRNRIDQYGVSEPIIHREGEKRIVVELPGIQDIERAKRLIGSQARLEFKILESGEDRASVVQRIDNVLTARAPADSTNSDDPLFEASPDIPTLSKYLLSYRGDLVVLEDNIFTVRELFADPSIQKLIPPASQFFWGAKVETMPDGQAYRSLYFVKSRVEMTGEILSNASVTRGQSFENAGQPVVNFTTTSEGVRIFSRVTGAHVGERMAIILDTQVYSAPNIRSKISQGSGIIEGSGTQEEAKDLAIVLRAGALPAPLDIVEDRTVGPSLGRDSIEQGKNAALIGLAIVIVFMMIYYGFSGFVANLALILNLVFVMAILAAFQGTLTLPGIAGIILTIGMAVDANVLILERIREELRAGKTARTAIENGYARAMLTIVDANVTTIITAVVLYQYGTGPIKGFALTLMVGILSSMFTAIFVTRTVYNFITTRQTSPSISVGKLRVFGDTAIDFLNLRKIAFIGSLVIILIGLGSAITKGGYNLGIDFAGGTLLEVHFQPAVPVGDIRDALSDVQVGDQRMNLQSSEIKEFGTPNDILIRVQEEAKGTAVADAIKTTLKSKFGSQIPNENDWLRRQEAVGPKIGEELKTNAIYAIIVSMILIIIYVWWRFRQIEFGVAAVIALFHDVMITMGVFSLTDHEISLAVVAALMTIVGYSLNDTIVVFDRIREDTKLYRRDTFGSIINRSINECLNRTFLTSTTTLLVVVSLMTLGGEVIYDFAFALLIGVVVGTYSSAFVAAPIVSEWHNRREAKEAAQSGRSAA
ncbi:MAG: protein translocase subunit SecD [Candidatus Latescibacteria bacterium]|nr:protein translocase subunit SecD [Candidatus Latescibacterota bacterium]